MDLETVEAATAPEGLRQDDRRYSVASLLELIYQLNPLDREVMLLYLEGEAADSIAEVTGISAANVATKIHRIKRVLKEKYVQGAADVKT